MDPACSAVTVIVMRVNPFPIAGNVLPVAALADAIRTPVTRFTGRVACATMEVIEQGIDELIPAIGPSSNAFGTSAALTDTTVSAFRIASATMGRIAQGIY